MGLELRVVPDGFAGVAPWWDAVVEASARPSPFATRAWLSTWWETYGRGGRLLVLSLVDGGQPAGGVAFYRQGRRLRGVFPVRELRLVGDRFVGSEGLDLVVRPGLEQEAAAAVARFLAAPAAAFDLIHLAGLRPGAVLLRGEALPAVARSSVAPTNRCPFLRLDSGRPAVPLSKSYASQVARRVRRAAEAGLRFARCETEEQVQQALGALFATHQERWEDRGEAGSFADPRKRDFYRRVAPLLFREQRLALYALWQGDQARAALFGATAGRTLYYLQSGFDPALASQSPGGVLMQQILRDAQARGFERFDFMKGDEAYKYRWTSEEEPLLLRRGVGSGWRGRLAFALARAVRRPSVAVSAPS